MIEIDSEASGCWGGEMLRREFGGISTGEDQVGGALLIIR